MTSRERVIATIEHRKPDRIPIYAWVRANLEEPITEAFGSVEAFEDRYEFDFAHIFGGPSPYPQESLRNLRNEIDGPIDPESLLQIELSDPNDRSRYEKVEQAIRHHKEERGRFVYVQTPGIFECLNGPFGIENHLMYLAVYEQQLHEVYRRQAEWNRAFAMNCLDLGIDMIHVSDDWGGQNALLFHPDLWWRLLHPHHKVTCDAVKKRRAYLSVHSDGYVQDVLDGIVDLGFDVVHPYQESAGMDYAVYRSHYADRFALMGGLDVQTTIGFGDFDRLRIEIDRVLELFADGDLLYCTSHFIQNHCTIEELTFAFDHIYRKVRELGT